MNPDTRIGVGDRVKVKRTVYGYAGIHVGRTGTVKAVNVRHRFYGLGADTYGTTIYRVEMDEPRPEQIDASEVEKVSSAIRVGDRVRISRTGAFGMGEQLDGKLGEVVKVRQVRPFGYEVRLDEKLLGVAQVVVVEQVEKVAPADRYDPATAAVGDRVVVLRAKDGDQVGFIGKVAEIIEPLKVGGETLPRVYRVAVTGEGDVLATKVAKTTGQPATAGTVSPTAPPATEEPADDDLGGLSKARLLAAKFAHELLGSDASLEDLIGLAEFVIADA